MAAGHQGRQRQLKNAGIITYFLPGKPLIALPDGKQVKIMLQQGIFNAVDGVQVFPEQMQIAQGMAHTLPDIPNRPGPGVAVGRSVRARIHPRTFDAGIFSVEFFSDHQFVGKQPLPVGLNTVVVQGAFRKRKMERAGIFFSAAHDITWYQALTAGACGKFRRYVTFAP
jgi:hypothetical protein